MAERYVERVGIMADSGINDIDAAFSDTEQARIRIEATHCLDWYSLEERRRFLANVEKWRGQAGLELMKTAIAAEWNRRKSA